MPDLTFVYRFGDDRRKIFQERRPWFLYSGSVVLDDGFDTTVSDDGLTSHTTSSRVVRPLAFFDPGVGYRSSMINPGDFNIRPLNFRRGQVSILRPQSNNVLVTYSTVHQFLKGRLTIAGVDALGALTDFAIYPTGLTDPQAFYVESGTDLDSGGVTQAWVRHNAIFVPHRNARYLGVGARALSVPNTGLTRNQYFRKWMLEKAHVGGTFPTTKYGKAREVVVAVKPDRLNLFPNPSFEVDASGIVAGSNATFARSTTKFTGLGVASLAVTATGAGNASIRSIVTSIPAKATRPYSLSGWVAPNTTARYVEFWLEFYNASSSLLQTTSKVTIKEIDGSTWVEAELPNKVAPANTAYVSMVMNVVGAAAGEVHYLDLVLLERSEVCLGYFDGSTSPETIWETGGTVGKTRSYLYKNRAERYAAIKRVLDENVPMGIGIADPLFGTLPADW